MISILILCFFYVGAEDKVFIITDYWFFGVLLWDWSNMDIQHLNTHRSQKLLTFSTQPIGCLTSNNTN
jgi:hypothetical protein